MTEAEAGADASTGAGTADEDMSLQTIYGNLFLVVRKDAAQKAAYNMDVLDMYLLTKNRCVDVHTHTHTHIYIYIYIYTFVYVSLSLSMINTTFANISHLHLHLYLVSHYATPFH